jgi:hypothetical protein
VQEGRAASVQAGDEKRPQNFFIRYLRVPPAVFHHALAVAEHPQDFRVNTMRPTRFRSASCSNAAAGCGRLAERLIAKSSRPVARSLDKAASSSFTNERPLFRKKRLRVLVPLKSADPWRKSVFFILRKRCLRELFLYSLMH